MRAYDAPSAGWPPRRLSDGLGNVTPGTYNPHGVGRVQLAWQRFSNSPQHAGRGSASPARSVRPRVAGPAGGMPVIAPMPAARPARISNQRDGAEDVAAGTTVDHLTETYRAHYRSLLGLAALLLDNTASCEDVVQEAFIRVHSARKRVRDPEKTLAYLRQTVVNSRARRCAAASSASSSSPSPCRTWRARRRAPTTSWSATP
ncbi:hypothetical protein STENM327S_05746 [Streptomyces tendae]